MKAYVVVKGKTHIAILQALLPPDLLAGVSLVAAGDRANLTSVARTLLVTRRKPAAVLLDTESVDESIVQERAQTAQELLKLVAAGVRTKVILFVPCIEAIFFQASGLLAKIFRDPLPEEVRLLSRNSPKEALRRLFAHSNGPKNIHALLDRLDDAGRDAVRATPPVQELITFLQDVVNGSIS